MNCRNSACFELLGCKVEDKDDTLTLYINTDDCICPTSLTVIMVCTLKCIYSAGEAAAAQTDAAVPRQSLVHHGG